MDNDGNIISLSQYQRAKPRSIADALEAYAKHLTDFRSMSPRTVEVYIYEASRFLKFVMSGRLTADDLVDARAILKEGNGDALLKTKETFIVKVSISDVKGYISLLKERGTAAATLHKIFASLKSFLHYAFRQGLTDGDISKDMEEEIRLPKIGHQPVKVLSREEVEKLFGLPDLRTLKGRRDMVILRLGLIQGLRRFEMGALTVDDVLIKLDRPHIRIHGKGAKVVEVPLRDDVYAAIESYLRYRPKIDSPQLLVTAKKPYNPMSPKTIWKLMETLGKRIGIRADVHSLRRAALSFTALESLGSKGEAGSVLLTQSLARHEHASTTFRYIKDASQAKDPAVLHNPLGRDGKRKEDKPDAIHPDDTD